MISPLIVNLNREGSSTILQEHVMVIVSTLAWPAGASHPEWLDLLERFQRLTDNIRDALGNSEASLQSYKMYKAHKAELEQFLQRCRDKVHTVEQRLVTSKYIGTTFLFFSFFFARRFASSLLAS